MQNTHVVFNERLRKVRMLSPSTEFDKRQLGKLRHFHCPLSLKKLFHESSIEKNSSELMIMHSVMPITNSKGDYHATIQKSTSISESPWSKKKYLANGKSENIYEKYSGLKQQMLGLAWSWLEATSTPIISRIIGIQQILKCREVWLA